jgi:hypothetical protein
LLSSKPRQQLRIGSIEDIYWQICWQKKGFESKESDQKARGIELKVDEVD